MKIYKAMLLGMILLLFSQYTFAEITPTNVYTKLFLIKEEIEMLKRYFNINQERRPFTIHTAVEPHHVWQQTYTILFKINILRRKHGLPMLAVSSLEPSKNPVPQVVYEQALRILTELRILKEHLGITLELFPPPEFKNKTKTDNFNLSNYISYQLDLLNGVYFEPNHVFAQAIRISEDIDTLLDVLEIKHDTIPPPKQEDAMPSDAFDEGLAILAEIKRINDNIEFQTIDFNAIKPDDKNQITPSEVFVLTSIILAELQPLKSHLDLKYTLTPMAQRYSNKIPGDTKQILGWSLRKIQLIKDINSHKNK